MSKYNAETVIAAADFDTVASALGLTVGKKRNYDNVPFLCPAHPDKKIGNCSYSKKKKLWHCFACQEGGNIVQLVSICLYGDKKHFSDSLDYLGDLFGLPKEDRSARPRKPLPFLSMKEQETLGIHNGNILVERIKPTEEELADPYFEYEYRDKEIAQRSVLMDLYENDFDAYVDLIHRKYQEKLERATRIQKDFEESYNKLFSKGLFRQALQAKSLRGTENEETLEELEKIRQKYNIA